VRLLGPDRRFQQVRRLTELGRALAEETSAARALDRTLREAGALLDTERAALAVAGPDGAVQVRASPEVADRLGRLPPDALRSLGDEAIEAVRELLEEGIEPGGFLAVPLVVSGRVAGVLAVVRAADSGPGAGGAEGGREDELGDAAGGAAHPVGGGPAGRVADHRRQDDAQPGAGGPGRAGGRRAVPALRHGGGDGHLAAGRPPERATARWWDRIRVEQVIANVVSNAIKYGAGKPVRVAVIVKEGMAELVVKDHGIGVSRQDAQRIFGRFERAASVQHYGGLGLGLFIARQIVLAHGGDIRVQSEPGHGAELTVRLPRLIGMAAHEAQPQSQGHP
jgi:anti-sigma regulatory factor (Ser/Thr protein kinase)